MEKSGEEWPNLYHGTGVKGLRGIILKGQINPGVIFIILSKYLIPYNIFRKHFYLSH